MQMFCPLIESPISLACSKWLYWWVLKQYFSAVSHLLQCGYNMTHKHIIYSSGISSMHSLFLWHGVHVYLHKTHIYVVGANILSCQWQYIADRPHSMYQSYVQLLPNVPAVLNLPDYIKVITLDTWHKCKLHFVYVHYHNRFISPFEHTFKRSLS